MTKPNPNDGPTPIPKRLPGRCGTCRFWIDAGLVQHIRHDEPSENFNQYSRECWAENPNTVPKDRRVHTGPFDLCRHWSPGQS